MDNLITQAVEYVTSYFSGDHSGHDVQHTLRVWRTAAAIAREEGADLLLVQLAALLHDVDDRKLSPQTSEGNDNAVNWMRSHGVPEDISARVVEIISTVSYSAGKMPTTLEGQIVQDADRLDAMGAIGIARTFAFGGSRGRAMHDPAQLPDVNLSREAYGRKESTSVNHFYEKLLLLKDEMHTATARRLAEHRHAYMKAFLQEFFAEWDGER